jgi:muramidase (phage lysozyme)
VRAVTAGGDVRIGVTSREVPGGITIHNSGGSGASGAYQFVPGTWNAIAAASGRGDLVGVDPASASPADQDAMALALYGQRGSAPWGGYCG